MEFNNWKNGAYLTLVILILINLATSFDITLTKGGYQGIVVAIHKDVPEDKAIIDNIKQMFVDGSSYLFNATNRRLYYKDVTIVIPETWTGKYNDTEVYSDYFSTSHVRIDLPNPEFGDAPYTLQPGECGEQGEYIHFTPKFIKNENGWSLEMYGESGKQLVHEWAHFRYGVFDEYGTAGDRRFPLFYLDGGKVMPSTCVKDVRGWIEREDGEPCILYENNFVGDDCLFIPNMQEDGQSLKASIMYMPFLPTMFQFCDANTQDLSKQHNWRAPTKQNAFCQYKSTWEVISKHVDLRSSQVPLPASTEIKPNFNILKFAGNQDRKVVLVMDVSVSMQNHNRITRLKEAGNRFVLDTLPFNVSLAMVVFSSSANTISPLTRLTNTTVRQKLATQVPASAPGSATSIGSGLREALKILRASEKPQGSLIILITDGDENTRPFIYELESDLVKAGIIVNTVAMGGAAEKLLENLATKTGGRSFYFPDNSPDASRLDSAFVSSVSTQVDIDLRPVTLVGQTIIVNKTMIRPVPIDKELGKNTEFTFRGSETDLRRVKFTLHAPDNVTKYDEGSDKFIDSIKLTGMKKFFFETAQTGVWLVVMNVTNDVNLKPVISFNMASEVVDPKVQPVRVKSWFDKTEVTFPASVKVLARVTKGYNVVLNATVKSTVVRPGSKDVELTLRDNGAGADAIKDDGIYSGYFRAFTGDGRYAAVATVVNDGQAKVKLPGSFYNRLASGAPNVPKDAKKDRNKPALPEFDTSEFQKVSGSIPDVQFETEPAESFSRNVDLGNFQLKNWISGDVGVKPDRVTDLRIEYVGKPLNPQDWTQQLNGSVPDVVVQLKWTLGANGLQDEESAQEIEIRGSLTGDEMIKKFENGVLIYKMVDNSSAPGEEQSAEFILPEEMDLTRVNKNATDIYLALVSVNQNKIRSDMSNIVTAHLGYSPPIETKEITKSKTGLIVGVVIGVLIAIGLIVGVLAYNHKK